MTRQKTMWTVFLIAILAGYAGAADWMGFRGPGSRGVSVETDLPTKWSESENLAWKTRLPGPGSSSPIILGDKVFITCYSGYGLDKDKPGDINNLKRHLLCISTIEGDIIWDKTVPATQPEDPYKGMLREHGYASQTPATDGERIYVFFGKSGVLAYDLKGTQLWQTGVGTDSDQKIWGSASSPALYKNMVFVNAWDESKTLYALDKNTGHEVWKKDLSAIGLTFSTPVITKRDENRSQLVFVAPNEVWGMNPETGGQFWMAHTDINDTMIPTPVIVDGVAYIHGGGPNSFGSLAVRTNGEGDVTGKHIVWKAKDVTSPPSPVVVGDFLYWVDNYARACCMDIATGKLLYSEKVPVTGRFAIYASAVAADGKIYIVTRKNGTFVLAAKPQFEILAHNKLASDTSDFNASPAISDKCIYVRSDQFLYCFKKKS